MRPGDLLKDEQVRHGISIFASLYAKRLLEYQYDKAIATTIGQKLYHLDRPAKLGIEAGLYALTSFLASGEDPKNAPAWKSFLAEVLKDAPAELSKRILNGTLPPHTGEGSPAPELPAVRALEQTLQDTPPAALNELQGPLTNMGDAAKQQLAKEIAGMVEREISRREQAPQNAAKDPQPPPPSPNSPSLMSDLTKGLRHLNERLENRTRKGG